MNQEIHFKGLSLTPDDHHTQPGELSVCTNVELHNGGLRPSVINGTDIANKLKKDNDIAKLLHVHTISNHTYLIGSVTTVTTETTTTNLYWFNEDGSYDNDNLIHSFAGVTVISVQSIGNTLSILTSDGLHYARLSNGKYLYIGSRMPELELAFALDVEDVFDDDKHLTEIDMIDNVEPHKGWGSVGSFDGLGNYIPGSYHGVQDDIDDAQAVVVTDAVLSVVNKFIDKYHQEGKFLFPFFVRYAYKLYDNRTITMHSAPILMPCGSGTPYAFCVMPYTDDGKTRLNFSMRMSALAYTLKYKLCNSNLLQELEKWSDVITGVEIYISQPLYRYDASGQVKTIVCIADNADVTYRPFQDAFTVCNGDGGYKKRMVKDLCSQFDSTINWAVSLPLKDEDDYNKEIRECSEFFLLKTIDISKLATEMTEIEIKEGYLKTLTAQKQMTDDYDSHDTIMPQQIYMYNNRINAVDITKKLFSGYLISSQYAYKSAHNVQGIIYFIEQEGRQVKVWIDENQSHGANEKPYLFYPNPNAKFAIIAYSIGSGGTPVYKYRKVPLKGHSFLNGAVYFNDIYTQEPGVEITREEFEQIMAGADSNNIIPTPNKVYTSEIDNPYYFPVEGIATVGVGRIIGLAGITRALSPGQMGVHKMMAFCTDGVWALTVGDVGLFGNADRISFDVCVSKESICQLGQSVLFATDKGISRVRESDVQSVSDALDGAEFDISELPGLTAAVNQYLGSIFIGPNTPQLNKSPLEFLKSARLVYDFPNSRVIAFSASPNDQIAMVLASDGTWSVMRTPAMTNHVVGYPYTYIELSDGQLIRLDMGYNYLDESRVESLIVTRSLSWSSTMQVIQSFQQIHNSGHNTLLILYGSNDGRTWSYIGKSERSHASYLPGHPFRFFRVAILMQLKQSEIYSKLILDVKDKYEKL